MHHLVLWINQVKSLMLAIPLGPYELICNLLNPRLAIYKLKIHESVHLSVWVVIIYF